MMFRMMVALFLVLCFVCSTLAVSATRGRESLPILSNFPYQCNGPFKGKKLSREIILKVRRAHEKWLINSKDPEARQANLCGANLTKVNFKGVNLTSAVFRMAMLEGANFSGATLNKAQLQGANLSGANFYKAHLVEANLDDTMLHLARFQQTNLRKASLRHTMLYKANLQDAVLYQAILQDANLSNVVKLTQLQINQVCLHGNTKLPKGLTPPVPCNVQKGKKGGLALKKAPSANNLPNKTIPAERLHKIPPSRGLPLGKAPSTSPLNKIKPSQRKSR
jgi:pentapeptide repeat protein